MNFATSSVVGRRSKGIVKPYAFYSGPRFRSSSLDIAKLRDATELTLDTTRAAFALARGYYRVEAFANAEDRDAACGPTEHDDVRYFPVDGNALLGNGIKLGDIGCGYSLDHSAFEETLTPIFCAVRQVVSEVSRALEKRGPR